MARAISRQSTPLLPCLRAAVTLSPAAHASLLANTPFIVDTWLQAGCVRDRAIYIGRRRMRSTATGAGYRSLGLAHVTVLFL